MSKINSPTQDRSKESKDRILKIALELFANNGYDKTSTREIADKANVNISAIKYYFGDKESLYKTVYKSFIGPPPEKRKDFKTKDTLEEELEQMFGMMLDPFTKSQEFKLGCKLHMREQLDPMGLWKDDIENDIKPKHTALVDLVKKEIPGISLDEANRLVFSMVSLSIGIFVNQDVINAIDSKLITVEESLVEWKRRLVKYAKAMIDVEKSLRKKKE